LQFREKLTNVDFSLSSSQKGEVCPQIVKQSDIFCENVFTWHISFCENVVFSVKIFVFWKIFAKICARRVAMRDAA
jgi:hypothetical protein